ncbi:MULTISPECIES: hypothetical protein [Thermus]|nr:MULTISPECIES: hypothetical protein [Thermus]
MEAKREANPRRLRPVEARRVEGALLPKDGRELLPNPLDPTRWTP